MGREAGAGGGRLVEDKRRLSSKDKLVGHWMRSLLMEPGLCGGLEDRAWGRLSARCAECVIEPALSVA